MGVEGDEDFRAFWLHDAFMKFPGYRIAGILFFNSADTPGAWGSDLPTPDWRGNQPAISALVGWVKQQAGIANQGKGI